MCMNTCMLSFKISEAIYTQTCPSKKRGGGDLRTEAETEGVGPPFPHIQKGIISLRKWHKDYMRSSVQAPAHNDLSLRTLAVEALNI